MKKGTTKPQSKKPVVTSRLTLATEKAAKKQAKKKIAVKPLDPHPDVVSDSRPATMAEVINHTDADYQRPEGELAQPLGRTGKPRPAAADTSDPTKAEHFFDGHDSRLQELSCPAVYREAGGSHTTILLSIGRTKARHTPMDNGGIRVVTTNVKDFRAEWLKANYDVAKAAAKYLKASQFEVAPKARAALQAVADGGDAKAVVAALERPTADPVMIASDGSIAQSLLACGRTKPKKNNLPKGVGLGDWVREQLLAKVPDDKIVAEAAVKFPGKAFLTKSKAHLAWYRGQLKREGRLS